MASSTSGPAAAATGASDDDDDRRRGPKPTKKLVGASLENCPTEALEGLVAVNPGLRLLGETRNVVREDLEEIRGRVAVVAGGGSGHEPYAAGFVGKGMLAAAVPGSVFVSAPSNQAYPVFQHLDQFKPSGILMFVINYTGDRLNFGLAVEKAKRDGINIEMFISGDDCAQTGATAEGRRGLTGSVMLLKIAGAMAASRATLAQILNELKVAAAALGTIGICLNPCSLPGQPPLFSVDPDRMELGLGIHGEAGVSTMPLQPVSEIVEAMFAHMTDRKNPHRLSLDAGEEVAVMINNLGGTSKLEELIVCKAAIAFLEKRHVAVIRAYNGHLMTSLEMAGVQISVLKFGANEARKKRWLKFLDAPAEVPGWPHVIMSKNSPNRFTPYRLGLQTAEAADSSSRMSLVSASLASLLTSTTADEDLFTLTLSRAGMAALERAVRAAARALASNERLLNDQDSGAGDGDCGTTICRGVRGIIEGIDKGKIDLSRPQAAFAAISDICGAEMGGSSGALYSLFFAGAARCILEYESDFTADATPAVAGGGSGSPAEFDVDFYNLWVKAFGAAIENVQKYGGAEAGDRTMLDAMLPALMVLRERPTQSSDGEGGFDVRDLLNHVAVAAQDGADSTLAMRPRVGRASRAAAERLVNPDPGATAAAVWIRAVCEALATSPDVADRPLRASSSSRNSGPGGTAAE